jgi:predicted DNA binding CopG/RHH family protein
MRSEVIVVATLSSDEKLKPISIRMDRQTLRELKFIAQHRGVGYQTLVREVLTDQARKQLFQMVQDMQDGK